MPLNPPPTIELGLGLIVQPLQRSDQSRAAEVTFAVNVAGVPSPTVAQDSIDDFQTAFQTRWGPQLDTDVTILQPSIKLGDGSTTPFEAIGAGAVANGANAGAQVPPSVALLLKKSTGLGGRQNHGRTYMPFVLLQAQVNENGTIPSATLAAFDTIAAQFVNDLIADGIPMVIAHKTFNAPLPPHHVTALHTGPLVTSWTSESLIGTQRRRLGR